MQINPAPIVILAISTLIPACVPGDSLLEQLGTVEPFGTPFVASEGILAREPSPPVSVGTSQTVGNLSLVVTNVIRPANHIADDATFYTEPDRGMEYVAVDIKAHCDLPPDQSCMVSSFDFGAEGASGTPYRAEILTLGVSRGFETGDLPGGKSRSGHLFFLVWRDDSGLAMYYPQSLGFALNAAALSIEE